MKFPLIFALSPAFLAAAWLVSQASWFWIHRAELNFGWIVLLLCLYLLWEAWEECPSPRFKWSVASGVAWLLGLGLLFVVQIYQAAFGMSAAVLAGLAIGTMGIIVGNLLYVFGGEGIRKFGFVFAFLLVALPFPSAIYNPIVSGLQSLVTVVTVEVLKLLGIPAEQLGNLIRLPGGVVGVDEACSGIRSLQATLMASIFIGYLSFRHRSLQAMLLFAGLLFAIAGNILRSLVLSWAANSGGAGMVDRFHDPAGWSVFAFTATGLALFAWGLQRLERRLSDELQATRG